jgi:hypothetical protein
VFISVVVVSRGVKFALDFLMVENIEKRGKYVSA